MVISINEKGKKFSEWAGLLGCATSLKGDSQAGMGIAVGDTDGNGVEDLIVTHLDGETNAAYMGNLNKNGDSVQLFFTESGAAKGVQKISRPMTGFGVRLVDLDNDGDLDLLTANGANSAQLVRNVFRESQEWIGFRVVDSDLGGRVSLGSRRCNGMGLVGTRLPCSSIQRPSGNLFSSG